VADEAPVDAIGTELDAQHPRYTPADARAEETAPRRHAARCGEEARRSPVRGTLPSRPGGSPMATHSGTARIDAAIPDRVRGLVDAVVTEVRRRLGARARIVWFGSWVTGHARPGSDIDLAIDAPGGVDPGDYAALWSFADELLTLYTIDLVNLAEADAELRREIERTGKEL
jgi:predicted nucleotidyltransferase